VRIRWSSIGTAEQPDVGPTAGEQHVVERLGEIFGRHHLAATAHHARLCRAAHQLLDEGRADTPSAHDSHSHDLVGKFQSAAIEAHLVDTPWTSGERAFELLWPVGGENEQDVGVFRC
jgi:hypothetical protein